MQALTSRLIIYADDSLISVYDLLAVLLQLNSTIPFLIHAAIQHFVNDRLTKKGRTPVFYTECRHLLISVQRDPFYTLEYVEIVKIATSAQSY